VVKIDVDTSEFDHRQVQNEIDDKKGYYLGFSIKTGMGTPRL
jgi:hypothetical protein